MESQLTFLATTRKSPILRNPTSGLLVAKLMAIMIFKPEPEVQPLRALQSLWRLLEKSEDTL